MTGWPALAVAWYTSRTKFGCLWVPNFWLKMSMQFLPHDGVAADAAPAVSVPAAPMPPTSVSVAAAAKTLLLKDISACSSLRRRPCPVHDRGARLGAADRW